MIKFPLCPTLLLCLIQLCSCGSKPQGINNQAVADSGNSTIFPRLLGQFADSVNIGQKGQNRLEIYQNEEADGIYINILFWSRRGDNKWQKLQTFRFDSSLSVAIEDEDEVTIGDYNNDGFLDFTYRYDIGARSANNLRRLFIYSPTKKELVYIRNSENYPNLAYNDKLNCLDAFLVYGGSSTAFLKIQADSLFEFARVDLWDNRRTVTEINKNGEETVLLQDSINDGPYIRYRNYKPLEE